MCSTYFCIRIHHDTDKNQNKLNKLFLFAPAAHSRLLLTLLARGAYASPCGKVLNNSELARAEGPSFRDF